MRAQETIITGTVQGENQDPLYFATVFSKNEKKGVKTDILGFFELKLKSSNDTLVFSFPGYEKKEIAVSGTQNPVPTARCRWEAR